MGHSSQPAWLRKWLGVAPHHLPGISVVQRKGEGPAPVPQGILRTAVTLGPPLLFLPLAWLENRQQNLFLKNKIFLLHLDLLESSPRVSSQVVIASIFSLSPYTHIKSYSNISPSLVGGKKNILKYLYFITKNMCSVQKAIASFSSQLLATLELNSQNTHKH